MKLFKVMTLGFALCAIGGAAFSQDSKTAPDFKAKDAAGVEHSLSKYKGKIVVLNFTNPGSPTSGVDGCPFEVPRYEKKSYHDTASKVEAAGGVYLAVNSNGHNTPADTQEIEKKYGVKFPTLIDSDGTIGKAYQAGSTPHAFVINKEGKIIYDGAYNDNATPDVSKDATAKNYILEAVNAANKGEAPKVSKTRSYGCGIKYKN